MTVAELEERMSAEEFTEWLAVFDIEHEKPGGGPSLLDLED